MRKFILVLLIICFPFFAKSQDKTIPIARKLQMAEFLIHKMYVDSLDENKLVEAGIKGMLNALDPHSTYSDPEEVRLFNESMDGEFEGIGIQYQILQDTLYVIQTIPNGPSDKAGLLPGDRIIAVDTNSIVDKQITEFEVIKLLRGPKKSKVNLSVVRRGIASPLSFTIERNRIPIESVDACYMLTSDIGFIRLNQFGKNTAKEFTAGLKELKSIGATSLVLDLRGNSGGFLDSAIDIVNHFLQAKQRIVYAKGNKVNIGSFYAKGDGVFKTGKVVVLIDEFSASASEIVAGAIQDWDRGLIIGRRSFGKGLVQRPIDLFDGSMIRLTIARYYTPSGRCIQKPYAQGGNSREEYRLDLLRRIEHGELVSKDSILLVDSLKYQTLIKHRCVYGGGGIMPDIFTPIDTTFITPFYKEIISKGIFMNTILKYLDENRLSLKTKYTLDSFISSFSTPKDVILSLQSEMSSKYSVAEMEASSNDLKILFKAIIARDLWNIEAFYKVRNSNDPIILKSLEILTNGLYDKILI